MKNTELLIARLRKTLTKQTDYAVAKALDMSQSQLADVLKGKYGLGPKAAIRLHEILGIDVRDVLVLIEEDKAKTDHDREFWSRRSPRITASIALAIVASALAVTFGTDAEALAKTPVDALHAIHYANWARRQRRKFTRHQRYLSTLTPKPT